MPRGQLLFVVPQKVTKKGTKGGQAQRTSRKCLSPLEPPSQHRILCGGEYESPCHFVTSPFRQGDKETKFFCVWGVIGKTHGLPRAPSSRELSAKLTEGVAERSEAEGDKKPALALTPVL